MLNIFTNTDDKANKIYQFTDFEVISLAYQQDITKVINYYQDRVMIVKQNHFLVNLINNLSTPIEYDIQTYIRVVESKISRIVKTMLITSPTSFGKFHSGIFYDRNTLEVIIQDTEYFNPFTSETSWRELSAVKVLTHPKSDMSLYLPNGKYPEGEIRDIAVVSINVSLLMVQYRSFLLDQEKNGIGLSVQHFVHMYVLSSMLTSHVDVVIMNRFMNSYYGKPNDVSNLRLPFPIHNYSSMLETVMDKILKRLTGTLCSYSSLLKTLPSITCNNMEDTLQLPDVTPTNQVVWALLLSRLNYIKFLIDYQGSLGVSNNRTSINNLKRLIFNLQRNHTYNHTLPGSIRMETEIMLDILVKV